MPVIHRLRRNDLLTLLVVLFAAALVRLSDPGIVEFKLDEAWVTRLAREWVAGGPLPLTGMPSSVGIPNPPTSVYVMAIPYAFTSDPVIATMFVAALNVVGVGLLWLLAFRYWGRDAALVAGLTYALSPWAVYYSRKIWAQDFHTPFLLAALLLGMLGFLEGKRWAQVLCLPLLIFALQIHFAALVLLPLYLWLLWQGRQRVWWPGLGISLLVAALTLAPYAAGLSQRGDVSTTLRDRNALTITGSALVSLANLSTGLGLEQDIAPQSADALLAAVPPASTLWVLLGLSALGGLALIWTLRYRVLAGLVTLWVALPLLVFSLDWTTVFPHYFIASIPALCLLVGIALDWMARTLPGQPFTRTIVLVGLVAVLSTQFMWWRGVMRFVAQGDTEGFGTPLGALMPIRDALLTEPHVVLVTDDARLDYQITPAIWHAMLMSDGRCYAAISGSDLAPFPQNPFVALVSPRGQGVSIDSYELVESAAFRVGSESTYAVYTARAEGPNAESWQDRQALFANGVRLTGVQTSSDRLWLRWETPAAQNTQYQFFVHVLDTKGERIAQYDGPFLDGRYWCDGVPVVTQQAIALTPDAATLRVGMYRLVGSGFANADLLDDAGNAAAPWYDMPLAQN